MGTPVAAAPGLGAAQVGFASAKLSPGVTTLALALGLVSAGPVLVGELDPAGGDLAGRLPADAASVGLPALAAAARHEVRWEALADHAQPLTGSCRVLLGPPDRVLSSGAVAVVASALPAIARQAGVAGLWDLGRLDPTSPAWATAVSCDLVVVVARAAAGELAHLVALLEALAAVGTPAAVVVAEGPRRRQHRDGEVADWLDRRLGGTVPLLGRMPFDPLGVSMAERVMPRWAGRTALGGSTRRLVAAIGALAAGQISGQVGQQMRAR